MLTTPRRRRRRARRGRGGCALMRATPIYGRERCKLEHVVAIERTTMCMCAREESVGVLVMYVLTLMLNTGTVNVKSSARCRRGARAGCMSSEQFPT